MVSTVRWCQTQSTNVLWYFDTKYVVVLHITGGFIIALTAGICHIYKVFFYMNFFPLDSNATSVNLLKDYSLIKHAYSSPTPKSVPTVHTRRTLVTGSYTGA